MAVKSLPAFCVLLCLAAGVRALTYNVVASSGKPCPGRDSCNNTLLPRGSDRGPIEKVDWKKRNCFCDLDCSKYGDCCVDSDNKENKDSALEFSCVNLKQYGNVYVKTNCPASSKTVTGNGEASDAQKACEGTSETDPIGNTPVTSLSSGFTYKNYFCALCHGDSSSIRFWKSRLECPTITGYSDRFRNISKDFVEERLEIRGGQWGLEIDTGGIGVFHRCQVDPAVPDELSSYIRSCPGQNMVESCPPDYQNTTVSEYCGAYTGIVHVGTIKYKNPYCAACHNVTTEQMTCYNLGPLGRFHWPKNFNTYSFAVLFDISGSGSVGKKCEVNTQVYDPYFKKCRNVICRNENSEYVNGKCVEKKLAATTVKSVTSSTSAPETTTTEADNVETTTIFSNVESSTFTTEVATSSTNQEPFQMTITSVQSPGDDTTTTIDGITTTIYETTEYILYSDEDLANVTTTTFSTMETELRIKPDEKIPADTITTEESPFENATALDDSTLLDEEEDVEVFSDCPKIILSPDEFQVLENESIYIPKYNRVFEGETYVTNNDSIIICLPEDDGKRNSEYYSNETETKFGYYMSYISLVCLGISIICLTLHVVASLISPELQNLNGKNLFCLSLCLLGGYSSFIAGMLLSNDGLGCKILGLVMYCFFLASFVWMFVISFDVCRSMMRATSELRVVGGSQWKKFFLYSLFGWSIPLSCGVIAAFADFYAPNEEETWLLKPGFGNAGLCWFSSKKALLLYFALPFGIIATGNLGFFIWIAFLLYNTAKDVAVRKLNYHLYLKLGVLMGLTWIVGLVAGFLDFEILWIIFIVLNTLQGLFIFLAFTCTKKVVNSLRNSLPSSTESFMFPSSSNSGAAPRSPSDKLGSRGHPPPKEYGGRTMYMVQAPKHNALASSSSFNKRYY